MCRHCERIVEDVEYKDTVHKFMEGLTRGINRTLTERNMKTRVTVDEVEFYVTMPSKEDADRVASIGISLCPSVLKLIYKDLMDSVK